MQGRKPVNLFYRFSSCCQASCLLVTTKANYKIRRRRGGGRGRERKKLEKKEKEKKRRKEERGERELIALQ